MLENCERSYSVVDCLAISDATGIPVVFDTHHDHRMAMALSLLSLCVTGVEVADPEVVTKSWPNYFVDMAAILGSNEMGN